MCAEGSKRPPGRREVWTPSAPWDKGLVLPATPCLPVTPGEAWREGSGYLSQPGLRDGVELGVRIRLSLKHLLFLQVWLEACLLLWLL